MRIALRLWNETTRAADLVLQGRPPAFDIVISDESGRTVWRRLAGETVVAVLQLRTLAPGEALTFDTVWDQHDSDGALVGPGAYRVVGELPGDPPQVRRSPPAVLRILP